MRRFLLILGLAGVLGAPVYGSGQPDGGFDPAAFAANVEENPNVTVRVYDYAGVKPTKLSAAQMVATRVYSGAGVEISWQYCDPQAPAAECGGAFDPSVLVMRILPPSMAKWASDGANQFGFALLVPGGFARTATVFYQRIADFCAGERVRPTTFLGLMMAHEIGHLLIGEGGHARSGVMRAKWRRQDVDRASQGERAFQRAHAERIRTNVAARVAAARGV